MHWPNIVMNNSDIDVIHYLETQYVWFHVFMQKERVCMLLAPFFEEHIRE